MSHDPPLWPLVHGNRSPADVGLQAARIDREPEDHRLTKTGPTSPVFTCPLVGGSLPGVEVNEMSRTNKYPAPCNICGGTVPVNGGNLKKNGRRWVVTHPACEQTGRPEVIAISFGAPPGTPGVTTYYQNSRGRCEDAPCCGCCTI